ncbi:DUF2066 domain-containing protein [Candidatus Macondimonas diazotrophica]|jgi:hypothetical protein|nr:DUF2066 domain-containing protein [Candidatus Macondimonas diazotrophica]NCU00626.1 DUF2066 domain-containing protein [Candidatus Macondimonas diazotrophica]
MRVTEAVRRILWCVGLWLAVLAVPLHAEAAVRDLYQARLPLDAGAAPEQSALFSQGLDQVVRRLVGPGRKLTDVRVEDLVIRYGYARDALGRRVFEATYDAAAVEAALARLGATPWTAPRPTTRLVVRAQAGHMTDQAGAHATLVAECLAQADRLGLPLNPAPPGIDAGEEGAAADSGNLVLALTLSEAGEGQWDARIQTLLGGQEAGTSQAGPATARALAEAAMTHHEAILRARLAPSEAAATGASPARRERRLVRIAVHGILQYGDYVGVASELRTFGALTELFLEEASPTTFIWLTNTNVPPESLIELLESGGRLRRQFGTDAVRADRLELEWTASP